MILSVLLQCLMFFALWSMSTASMFSLKLKMSVLQLVENYALLLVLLVYVHLVLSSVDIGNLY